MDFQEILYMEVLLKYVKKIQVWFKLGSSKKSLYKETYIHSTTAVSNITLVTLAIMVTSLLFLDF